MNGIKVFTEVFTEKGVFQAIKDITVKQKKTPLYAYKDVFNLLGEEFCAHEGSRTPTPEGTAS